MNPSVDSKLLERLGISVLSEIRVNHRWRTYSGILNGQKVFIKICADLQNLSGRLKREIETTHYIQSNLNGSEPFSVPNIISSGDDHIIYSFIDGELMLDTEWYNDQGMRDLYRIYQWFEADSNKTELGFLDAKEEFDQFLGKLEELQDFVLESKTTISKYFDIDYFNCLEYAINFLKKSVNNLSLVAMHGDLTPGNILINNTDQIHVIDWESFALRPKYYEVVNFTYNFALRKYKTPDLLFDYLSNFCMKNNADINDINIAFCVRFLTRIRESWGERSPHSASQGSADYTPEWLELSRSMMKAVIDGKFFFEVIDI
jgi:serine/threonine protein kinase